jgi:hypothetical protein
MMLVPATVAAGLLFVLGIVIVSNLDSEPDPATPDVPGPEPTTSFMWPQSSLEELQEAQQLASLQDPRYAWQIIRGSSAYQPAQNHPFHSDFFDRFIVEVLGWERFLWDESFAHRDGLVAGDVLFVRCAAGETNPLYPDDSGGGCAPTIDDLRYETVKIHVAQLDDQGRELEESDFNRLWVVTGWDKVEPAVQITPPSEAEITTLVEPFLQARIAGAGAEDFVVLPSNDPYADDRTGQPIPLLYATTSGAPYERWDFEVVDGPTWPNGRMKLEIRLFTETGETVEQVFVIERDEIGRLQLAFDFEPTSENGKAFTEYGFLDGQLTYRAPFPLGPSRDGYPDQNRLAIVGVLPDDSAERTILLMLADPRPIGPECVEGPVPADAEALAQSILSDPDFEASAPLETTIGGIPALQIDVFLAPGSSFCPWSVQDTGGDSPHLLKNAPFTGAGLRGNRARLYLLDLPGESAGVLALAMITDDDSFEPVLQWAERIVDSIEFTGRSGNGTDE